MSMSWIQTLGALDHTFEGELARRDMQQGVLFKIAQERENQRENAARERIAQQQQDDNADHRHELALQRKQAQDSLDFQRSVEQERIKAETAQKQEALRLQKEQEAQRDKLLADPVWVKKNPQTAQGLMVWQATGTAPSWIGREDPEKAADRRLANSMALQDHYNQLAQQREDAKEAAKQHAQEQKLAPGLQNYISVIARKHPGDFTAAVKELNDNWAKQTAPGMHEHADLKEAGALLRSLYTRPDDNHMIEEDALPAGAAAVKEEMVPMRTPAGDVVPIPKSKVAEATARGAKPVN